MSLTRGQKFSFQTTTLSLGLVSYRSSDPHDPLLRNGQVLVFYFRTMTLSLGMVKSRPSAKQWSLISWLHRGPLRGNGDRFLYIKTLSFGMVIDSFCRIETLSVRMVVDSYRPSPMEWSLISVWSHHDPLQAEEERLGIGGHCGNRGNSPSNRAEEERLGIGGHCGNRGNSPSNREDERKGGGEKQRERESQELQETRSDRDGLAADERAELRPGRNPRAEGEMGAVGDTRRSRRWRRSRRVAGAASALISWSCIPVHE
ncbi:hypothetical protein DEO72_LG2g1711 [Vigna unguiculata]|uniref:Uncharacterized protein n=1 Tax=Vigna unguiculata TaxID=3917 RepID=A0A4D6KTI4_VIGUN|nr:hypothetical protein DEO72_LG2g1711 [Vigna unguiculata]